jgi:hypothetical protein
LQRLRLTATIGHDQQGVKPDLPRRQHRVFHVNLLGHGPQHVGDALAQTHLAPLENLGITAPGVKDGRYRQSGYVETDV